MQGHSIPILALMTNSTTQQLKRCRCRHLLHHVHAALCSMALVRACMCPCHASTSTCPPAAPSLAVLAAMQGPCGHLLHFGQVQRLGDRHYLHCRRGLQVGQWRLFRVRRLLSGGERGQ